MTFPIGPALREHVLCTCALCVCARVCVVLNQYKDIVIVARWIQHIMSHHGARARGIMGDVERCCRGSQEGQTHTGKDVMAPLCIHYGCKWTHLSVVTTYSQASLAGGRTLGIALLGGKHFYLFIYFSGCGTSSPSNSH